MAHTHSSPTFRNFLTVCQKDFAHESVVKDSLKTAVQCKAPILAEILEA